MLTALLPLLALGGQAPLKLNVKAGSTAFYSVSKAETNYGSDGKKTGSSIMSTPIQLSALQGSSFRIVKGPVVINGRKVGRERVSNGSATQTSAPCEFFVVLPSGGAKVGQSWRAPFFGGPPLAAGKTTQYRLERLSQDKRFGEVSLSFSDTSSGRVTGKGRLFLRTSDGLLDHGSAKFEIAYLRPDLNNPDKLVVNSRTELAYTISQKRP